MCVNLFSLIKTTHLVYILYTHAPLRHVVVVNGLLLGWLWLLQRCVVVKVTNSSMLERCCSDGGSGDGYCGEDGAGVVGCCGGVVAGPLPPTAPEKQRTISSSTEER